MGKSNNKRRRCSFEGRCPVQAHPFSPSDEPNVAAHLFFRVLYTVVSWFVLAINIGSGWFTAVFLFVLPIFMDCLKFNPKSNIRKSIKYFELLITSLWCIFAILGLIGVCQVSSDNKMIETTDGFIGFSMTGVPIDGLWYGLGSVLLVTLVDWFCSKNVVDELKEEK